MRMILDVSRLLAVPTDLDRLLCQIAEMSCRLLDCERASIFLHDQARHELWTKVAIKSGVIRLKSDAGIVGHSFTHDEVVCVHDPYNDARFHREPDLHSGFVTRNLLSAPMKGLDGKPIGAIECVNKVSGVFGENDLSLIQLLADQAGVAVQRHQLQEQAVVAGAMQREMHLARRAQEKLIPKSAPPTPGLTAVGWTLPASATGGDCFDLWKLPDGRLGVLLADASGHGLAPAMIVAQARSLVRALSDLDPDPLRVLQRVNTRLMADLEPGQFVTAFLGFVSPDGELNWFSAGQGPLMVRPGIDEALRVIDPPVQPLGIEEWKPTPRPDAVKLHPGGQIILVSDGIFESTNPAGEIFGFDRMTAALDQLQRLTPIEVLTGLREAVRQWRSGGEPLDDETIVVVQREMAPMATASA
jgi:phosphoserine phosphatase RsbU/P